MHYPNAHTLKKGEIRAKTQWKNTIEKRDNVEKTPERAV
jgi:hypothetical protein